MNIKELKRVTTYYTRVRNTSALTWELTDGHLYRLTGLAGSILLGARHRGGEWELTDLWSGLLLQRYPLPKKEMEFRLADLSIYNPARGAETELTEWYSDNMEREDYYIKHHTALVEYISSRRGIDPDIRRYITSDSLADAMGGI